MGPCASGAVDALLIDERAAGDPRTRGADACGRLVNAGAVPLPAMVLAREIVDPRQLDALFDAGAWGLATYPFGGGSWVSQLAAWVRRSSVPRAEGLVDPTTRLYNERGLLRRAREVEAAARRDGSAVACAVFTVAPRVDGDATGPAERGGLAQRVADACRSAGRGSDVFARLTPHEFGVIAPGADATGVRRLVDRIGRAIAGTMAAEAALRVGVFAVPNVRLATVSVADMLTLAATDC